MANPHFAEVIALYTKRRTDAQAKAEQNRAHFHSMCPEAIEIDRALNKTAMKLFSVACNANGEEKEAKLSQVKAENQSLQQAKADLLKALGLPADYTEPKYTCPLCKDSGYVDVAMCACMKKELTKAAFRHSGLGALAEKHRFDNFSLDYYKKSEDRAQMEANFKRAMSYAEQFSPASPNLLLLGYTGLGKTHLSTAIACAVVEKGYYAVCESAQNILSDFEADQFRSYGKAADPKGEKYLSCDFLVIDDLGTEFQSAFSLSCLYNLINTRVRSGKPTLVNTNLTPADLRARYDDRIASRLLGEFQIMLFKGEDIRFQKL
ncbi:MAG: ATP-binding protein [Clostridia bacterium]|nr:ATP-binding protein [Clostridia bacterium]